MSRLAAFWRAYCESFAWVGGMSDFWKKVGPFVLFLGVAVTGVGTAAKGAEINWLQWLQPWSPYLFLALLVVAIWKAGRAWQATEGPLIWIGGVEKDSYYQFFEFRVENRGPGQVAARAYATALNDENGVRIPRIDYEIELHRRGYQEGQETKLYGNKHMYVAMLEVQKGPNPGTALLNLATPSKEQGKFGKVPLVDARFLPLRGQHRCYLTIRVDFQVSEGNVLTRLERFVIQPDEKQPMLYSVCPVGWF